MILSALVATVLQALELNTEKDVSVSFKSICNPSFFWKISVTKLFHISSITAEIHLIIC